MAVPVVLIAAILINVYCGCFPVSSTSLKATNALVDDNAHDKELVGSKKDQAYYLTKRVSESTDRKKCARLQREMDRKRALSEDYRYQGLSEACNHRMCANPTVPVFGGIKETKQTYRVGSIIHYYCNYGYTLRGAKWNMCLISRSWKRDTPICKSKQHNYMVIIIIILNYPRIAVSMHAVMLT